MKKLIVFITFFILVTPVNAGIWGTEQVIEVTPGNDIVSCNYWVYSTIPKETAEWCDYEFVFPGLDVFVKNITPNNFQLEEIPCPRVNESTPQSEISTIENLRKECLLKTCEMDNKYGNSTSCKRICVTFTGPLEIKSCLTNLFKENKSIPGCAFSLKDEDRVFEGGVADVIKVERTSFSNGASFKIVYKPINITPYLIVGALVLFIVGTIVFIIKIRKED